MIGRRTALTAITAVGALVLAACGSGLDNGGSAAQSSSGGSGTIKIGYVSPQTGALAPFGEADTYVINQMTTYFKDHPLQIGIRNLRNHDDFDWRRTKRLTQRRRVDRKRDRAGNRAGSRLRCR